MCNVPIEDAHWANMLLYIIDVVYNIILLLLYQFIPHYIHI